MADENQVAHAQLQRDFGRLEGKTDAIDERVKRTDAKLDAMNAKLDALITSSERQKGARRALLGVSTTVAAIVGGAASAAVSWFK